MSRKLLHGNVWLVAALLLVAAMPVAAQESGSGRDPGLRVYAHTLKHRSTSEVLAVVRPLLSARGTVQEQPGTNTLVIRDQSQVVGRVIAVIAALDQPPSGLRLDIQVLRAGPRRNGVSPPVPDQGLAGSDLPAELVERLRGLLRYDHYQVLARAEVISQEGEEVTYSLGQGYDVNFHLGSVLAGQRLKLEGFRILKKVRNPANKTRWLAPRELFHATLNLWMDRPFTLVLAQEEGSREALMVAITCHREDREP